MDTSIYGIDENGNAAVRVTKNAATTTDPTSIYGVDENGNAAMRIMGIGGGEGGTSNYNELSNKPKINGVTLSGDKSASDLGISGAVQISVNGTATAQGFAIPKPTAEEMTAIYNAVVAGNSVQIVDKNNVYYQVMLADSMDGAINVEVLFFSEMTILYSLEHDVVTFETKKLGGEGGDAGINWSANWDMPADWNEFAYPTYKVSDLPDGTYKVYTQLRSARNNVAMPVTSAIIIRKNGNAITGGMAPVLNGDTFMTDNYHYLVVSGDGSYYIHVSLAESGALYFASYNWGAWASDIGTYIPDHGIVKNCLRMSTFINVDTGAEYPAELIGVEPNGGTQLITEAVINSTTLQYGEKYLSLPKVGTVSTSYVAPSHNNMTLRLGAYRMWREGIDETNLIISHGYEVDNLTANITFVSKYNGEINGMYSAKLESAFKTLKQSDVKASGIFADCTLKLYYPNNDPSYAYIALMKNDNSELTPDMDCEVLYYINRLDSTFSTQEIYVDAGIIDIASHTFINVPVAPSIGDINSILDNINGEVA